MGCQHLADGIHRLFCFSLLNEADDCVGQNHRQNDESIYPMIQNCRDDCGSEQHVNQDIVELQQKTYDGTAFWRLSGNRLGPWVFKRASASCRVRPVDVTPSFSNTESMQMLCQEDSVILAFIFCIIVSNKINNIEKSDCSPAWFAYAAPTRLFDEQQWLFGEVDDLACY